MAVADVFVAFVREDQAFAESIAIALQDAGLAVSRSASVMEAIDASPTVVVLWTQASSRSRLFLDAADRAFRAGKMVLARFSNAPAPAEYASAPGLIFQNWSGDPDHNEVEAIVGHAIRLVSFSRNRGQASAFAASGGAGATGAVYPFPAGSPQRPEQQRPEQQRPDQQRQDPPPRSAPQVNPQHNPQLGPQPGFPPPGSFSQPPMNRSALSQPPMGYGGQNAPPPQAAPNRAPEHPPPQIQQHRPGHAPQSQPMRPNVQREPPPQIRQPQPQPPPQPQPQPQPQPPAHPDARLLEEAAFWRSVDAAASPDGYRAYLDRYGPGGAFGELAAMRLAKSNPQPAPQQPPYASWDQPQVDPGRPIGAQPPLIQPERVGERSPDPAARRGDLGLPVRSPAHGPAHSPSRARDRDIGAPDREALFRREYERPIGPPPKSGAGIGPVLFLLFLACVGGAGWWIYNGGSFTPTPPRERPGALATIPSDKSETVTPAPIGAAQLPIGDIPNTDQTTQLTGNTPGSGSQDQPAGQARPNSGSTASGARALPSSALPPAQAPAPPAVSPGQAAADLAKQEQDRLERERLDREIRESIEGPTR
jgi:hypothetical protein